MKTPLDLAHQYSDREIITAEPTLGYQVLLITEEKLALYLGYHIHEAPYPRCSKVVSRSTSNSTARFGRSPNWNDALAHPDKVPPLQEPRASEN